MSRYQPKDAKDFFDVYPPFSALALVDHEPNDDVVAVLRGYVNLRRVSRDLLTELNARNGVAHRPIDELQMNRPSIVVSINELLAAGKNRDALRRFCQEQQITIIPHDANVWQYAIPPFGKHSHLAIALTGCFCPYVLIADNHITDTFARDLFTEFRFGAVSSHECLFFWEGRRDRIPHVLIVGKHLLDSNGLLSKDNDLFVTHRKKAILAGIFGGLKVSEWIDAEPRSRLTVRRPREPSNCYPKGHKYTFQDLLNGFLYQASVRADDRKISVSYGLYS